MIELSKCIYKREIYARIIRRITMFEVNGIASNMSIILLLLPCKLRSYKKESIATLLFVSKN